MINHQYMGFPTTNMVFVKGEAELDNYPVKIGYTLWAKDIDQPVIYVKSMDSAGMVTKRIIDCIEREPTNNTQFVTKTDFEAFENRMLSLLQPKKVTKAGETNA